MKIEISHEYLPRLQHLIKKFKIRHGPFFKKIETYMIYIYPGKFESIMLLFLADTDIKIIEYV